MENQTPPGNVPYDNFIDMMASIWEADYTPTDILVMPADYYSLRPLHFPSVKYIKSLGKVFCIGPDNISGVGLTEKEAYYDYDREYVKRKVDVYNKTTYKKRNRRNIREQKSIKR